MKNRKLIISLIGVVLFAGGVFLSGVISRQPENPMDATNGDRNTVVKTLKIENQDLEATIEITGRVIPAERVDIFAEVTGVADYGALPFKTGNSFKRGQVLLKIDDREMRSSMASAKSQFMSTLARSLPDLKLDYTDDYEAWKAYLLDLDVHDNLPELPKVDNEQLRLFLTGRNIYSSFYALKEMENRLSKFTLRAPFEGSLTMADLNQHTLVRAGQKLGEFIRNGVYELEGSVLYNELSYFEKGQEITFLDVNSEDRYQGKLVRVNDVIDPNTQLVKVYYQLLDTSLKSGLYLEGQVPAFTVKESVELPIEALVDEGFVFVVQGGKAVKKSVSISRQDANSFIASGIPNGSVVIVEKKNSAFEGSPVTTI